MVLLPFQLFGIENYTTLHYLVPNIAISDLLSFGALPIPKETEYNSRRFNIKRWCIAPHPPSFLTELSILSSFEYTFWWLFDPKKNCHHICRLNELNARALKGTSKNKICIVNQREARVVYCKLCACISMQCIGSWSASKAGAGGGFLSCKEKAGYSRFHIFALVILDSSLD